MSHAAGYLIGVAVATVLIAAGTPVAIWWRNRRLGRLAARHPEARFVGGVARTPSGPSAAVLVVDADALRLFRLGGASVTDWAWSSVRSVRADGVRYGALRWPGLVVEVESRWEPTFHLIVFGKAWVASSTRRTEALAAITACREASGGPSRGEVA